MTDLLGERLLALANPIDDSDWLAVRRRARRPRRRSAAIAIAAAAAVLVAAPAVGGRLLDLLQGSPAPPEVQTYFAANESLRERLFAEAAAAGHKLQDRYSRVVPSEARGVAAIESPDGPIYLWAAPTEDGRQCWLIQAGSEVATSRPFGFGACDEVDPATAVVPGIFWTAERPTVQIVHARVYEAAIGTVDVELADAPALSLPVVSGHALGVVPKAAKVERFVARDGDGDVVERSRRVSR